METSDLIRIIAAQAGHHSVPIRKMWWMAVLLAVPLAAVVFLLTLGPRADFDSALHTTRFPFKFILTLTLTLGAFRFVQELSRPESHTARHAKWLMVTPMLLALSVVLELFSVPSSQWITRMVGSNSLACLSFIPLIGLFPLAVFIMPLHHGAPAHPARAGAVAGLLAGGIAASLYAAHCPDDSPLFVAIWYTIAVAALALLGALAAARFARW